MKKKLIEQFSRQIVLKNVGIIGQKKILSSKVLVVGVGGLGCPVAEFLSRAGIGTLGIVDYDKVSLSNLHRQSLYEKKDIGKALNEVRKHMRKRNESTTGKLYF